jgi:hypothetical protein
MRSKIQATYLMEGTGAFDCGTALCHSRSDSRFDRPSHVCPIEKCPYRIHFHVILPLKVPFEEVKLNNIRITRLVNNFVGGRFSWFLVSAFVRSIFPHTAFTTKARGERRLQGPFIGITSAMRSKIQATYLMEGTGAFDCGTALCHSRSDSRFDRPSHMQTLFRSPQIGLYAAALDHIPPQSSSSQCLLTPHGNS